MYKTKIVIAVGTVFLLGAASASYAADDATKPTASTTAKQAPLEQGEKSVNGNLAKDPDNKGLQTAAKHLEANEKRIAEKRAEKAEKHRAERPEKAEHAEKAERPEKVERPERAERPESASRMGR